MKLKSKQGLNKTSSGELPESFLKKLGRIYPREYTDIVETFFREKESSFRVNFLKTTLEELKAKLIRQKIKHEELFWPGGSFVLKSDLRLFQNKEFYRQGHVYIQNLSSMIPVLVLDPGPGHNIIDLCAAPGAKTSQIASLAGRNARIFAFDSVRKRYYKLLANLKQQGADFVKVYCLDGLSVRKKYPEYFDKILLDVPCSCEGRFFSGNPLSFKYWKPRKVKEMAHKQKRLLSSAIHALKPGGDLVYSTCTFSPEENEEIVDWALNRFETEVELVPIVMDKVKVREGLSRWKRRKFSDEIKGTIRILPDARWEGFFIAHLRKKK